ncbi:MAG: phosphoglycerate mutase family protein [Actinomycetota bacterium]
MPIYLIRHANAGRRQPGTHDRERPLDESGRAQSARIRDHLDDAGIKQILSSPALRCRQTVEPLAAEVGIAVEVDEALWEGRGIASALTLIARTAATGHAVALCSHGDVIPMTLDALAAQGVPLRGVGCAKGSIWRLDVTDGEIVAGSYTPTP